MPSACPQLKLAVVTLGAIVVFGCVFSFGILYLWMHYFESSREVTCETISVGGPYRRGTYWDCDYELTADETGTDTWEVSASHGECGRYNQTCASPCPEVYNNTCFLIFGLKGNPVRMQTDDLPQDPSEAWIMVAIGAAGLLCIITAIIRAFGLKGSRSDEQSVLIGGE